MSTSIKITTHDQLQSAMPATKRRSPLRPSVVILLLLVCALGIVWLHRRRADHSLLPSAPPVAREMADSPDAAAVQPVPLVYTGPAELGVPATTPPAQQAKPWPDDRAGQTTEQSPESSVPHLTAQETVPSPAVAEAAPVPAVSQRIQHALEKPIGVRLGPVGGRGFEIALRVPADARGRSLREVLAEKRIIDVLVTLDAGQAHAIGRATLASWQENTERNAIDVVLSFDKVPDLSALVLLTNARLSDHSKLALVPTTGKELMYSFSVNPHRSGKSTREVTDQ